MNLNSIRIALETSGVVFAPGLTAEEVKRAEKRFQICFPEDLRRLLMFALPTGRDFPNWRDLDDPALGKFLSWPLLGLWFDVQHNQFWRSEWGVKPVDADAAYELLRSRIESVPKLIPIFGHRYMPDRPGESGNPIFSVYQTDIIYYGCDLEAYLRREFCDGFGDRAHAISGECRQIEFWSSLVQ
jgi:hypothetical protein